MTTCVSKFVLLAALERGADQFLDRRLRAEHRPGSLGGFQRLGRPGAQRLQRRDRVGNRLVVRRRPLAKRGCRAARSLLNYVTI